MSIFFIKVFIEKKQLIEIKDGVPVISNLQNWDLQKGKYLKTSIAVSFFATISTALAIATLVLIIQRTNEPLGNAFETLTSQWAIVGYSFLTNLLILTFLSVWNRRMCSKLFYNNNFVEEVSLKKLNWFFKKESRIIVLLTLHNSIASGIFAIIIYKDIKKNNLQPLNNIINL
ncbi:MAG: hypothetical protein KFW07_00880 [Mycoplasmataceae bacterium]|nr:hypothetical protein [Mycoplasmataceae bacterium]